MAFLKKMKMGSDAAQMAETPPNMKRTPATPKLRINAHYDEYGDEGDGRYKKEELARLKAKHKAMKHHHDSMSDKEAGDHVRKSLKGEMLRTKARMMEMGCEDDE